MQNKQSGLFSLSLFLSFSVRWPWPLNCEGGWTFASQYVQKYLINTRIKTKQHKKIKKNPAGNNISNSLHRSTVDVIIIFFFFQVTCCTFHLVRKSSSAVVFTLTLGNLPWIQRLRADECSHLEVSYPPCQKRKKEKKKKKKKKGGNEEGITQREKSSTL